MIYSSCQRRSVAPSHLPPASFLSDGILSAEFSLCFDKCKIQECVCVPANVCSMFCMCPMPPFPCVCVRLLVNTPACLQACSPQHDRVVDCQMICSPPLPAMAPCPKDSLEECLSCASGRVHCLAVTGLVEGVVRRVPPSARLDLPCTSTMNLSVTRLSYPTAANHTSPSCLLPAP